MTRGGPPVSVACLSCGSRPRGYRPELAGASYRGKVVRCYTCGSPKHEWYLEWPKRTGNPLPPATVRAQIAADHQREVQEKAARRVGRPSTMERIDASRSLRGEALWEAFEDSAWINHASRMRLGTVMDEADAWLRTHEAERLATRVEEPANDVLRTYSMQDKLDRVADRRDYRGELMEQAIAGDEYAAWRVGELFGAKCLERKKVG